MNSLELFAGAGGLAMGMANAGFHHCGLVEWNHYACQTMRENPQRYSDLTRKYPIYECDARAFDYSHINDRIDVISGGPPCQPFSLGGKHKGLADNRDMFPQAVRAVRELTPPAFIFENVKGLTRQSFAGYLNYIILQLSYPKLLRSNEEEWEAHYARLLKESQSPQGKKRAAYDVRFKLLNAADYGVPQRRERVFIVGLEKSLGIDWTFPSPTHSQLSLLRTQWISGEYWDRHKVPKKLRPVMPAKHAAFLKRFENVPCNLLPWVTVRDALVGLPDPQKSKRTAYLNHDFIGGAKAYPGHTGSPLDEPSKTLKAGDHGVPGGENMIAMPDGTVRYFTIREAARIQTFPDDYVFHGSWSEVMRQLGNAVPVKLGETVAKHVYSHLEAIKQPSALSLARLKTA